MVGKYSRIKQSNQGFTLVETIVTIILIAILAVSVLPKFDGTSSFEPYTYRDQIKSALRLLQLKAMQNVDPTVCQQLLLTSTRLGEPDVSPCVAPSFSAGWQPWQAGGSTDTSILNLEVEANHHVTFAIVGASVPAVLMFDAWGRPTNACAGGCTIRISGNEDADLCVESEGYIHDC